MVTGPTSVRASGGVPGGMQIVHRVLPAAPLVRLDDYLAAGGGVGLAAAQQLDAAAMVALLDESGLRGRGGAGFPTGRKWAAVIENLAADTPATVVVNGAEGEPGTFKDRSILRANPFLVLEGALIAALAVGAERVIVAIKESFRQDAEVLASAIAELRDARWCDGITIELFEGPRAYLFGEETALLEAIDGRPPFPRLAPPYRRGVDEVVELPSDVTSGSGLAAHVEMSGPGSASGAAPTLVDNVETLANVAVVFGLGPDEFRSVGTAESPGTIVCTVTGSVATPGVAEVPMGTMLSEVLEKIGGGARDDHRIVAVLPGVSSAVVTAEHFDVALTYEAMAAIGSGLGSAGFVVFDDHDDMVAVAAGVSRFLYVESCGQCTPCKQDGGAISASLDDLLGGELGDLERGAALDRVRDRLDTVADGARCSLARQHETVVRSILDAFPDVVTSYVDLPAPGRDRVLVGELVDVHDGITLLDETILDRQPDWSDGPVDSGETPVERFTDHRAGAVPLP